MSKISTIAAFDFDGTLTYRDTLLPFLAFTKGIPLTSLNILTEVPTLLSYCVGRSTRQDVKETFIHRFWKKMSKEELLDAGKRFAEKKLSEKLRPEAVQQLRWHQKEGHRCVLVSANLDVYLRPWAEMMGFDHVICSEVAFDRQGRVLGTLKGLNCWGLEKANQLETLLGSRSDYLLYAYGDSRGDHEMLMFADYPFYCHF